MTITLSPADTLTQHEAETILTSFATARGRDGFSSAEAAAIIQWAHSAQVHHALLRLVLTGLADVTLDAGEIAIRKRPVE